MLELEKYMETNFPELPLRLPLFYSWTVGIRFELGTNWSGEETDRYLKATHKRAITLFESLHAGDDEIFVVVNVNDCGDYQTFSRKMNIFNRYVRKKEVRLKLKHTIIPYIYPEDDEDGLFKTHRFILRCKVIDIKYVSLLKAICNNDSGIKPSVHHDVFFINSNKKTIFHVYDDRGCDLLATTPETIQKTYEEYNDWILDYDREEINRVFK